MTLYGETVVLEDPWAASERRVRTSSSDGEVYAPMAGKVLEIRVEAGASVDEGEVLAVVESMKMQLEVRAPVSGTVAEVHAKAGSVLDGPDLLVVLEP